MARKVVAAIVDISFIKLIHIDMVEHSDFVLRGQKQIIKRCLVYDPNKVVPMKPACKGKKADI